ncbi:uncharacterized protein LOC127249496 [Andrographis paniculata]|uniref:uncharacterized protein LOC127249496 n=1 Tax=Andrographis paniculata TaxID=175694 RepID=UPI0021E6DC23|nr:uncharacterized protein LOC127249496 [Andrographis paniculata]XP_051128245.1 uncharacterized protein LOC127249496 [Andrographis paniculata]XP_051128246.1 uncharacterized protein LOC127249496 [Andrographis paniculata]XP_051128248.1 uncharacterized protein LOC127249496 [Andrographis paniculata]XP_051128249.1 uncharacterized protein LOC127249496 [Andrographis paniculata]XP_051128250.1 uncharacterized protein LOC127249496 [Andrographis paniculata]XP_051128251.1 uncharacterized protein LOC12724
MDSPQSVVSPLKNSSILPEFEKHVENPSILSRDTDSKGKETIVGDSEDFHGALEVYIHQARDIHNICIYQNQDVYAKLCLTSDPEKTVSSKIINGGGRNPIFNENLGLNVRKVDSSLKCEIWMLSRVRNYLEDQLLGFALVPVSEILLHNGKLEKEFSLSSTELFHSPAGFVQLSISYIGTLPEVIPIPAPQPKCNEVDPICQDSETAPEDFEKIEFPDPKIVNENNQMVEEYIMMPCPDEDSQPVVSVTETQVVSDIHHEESFSTGSESSRPQLNFDSPPSSVSTHGTSYASVPASFQSSEAPKDSKTPNVENVLPSQDTSKKNSARGDVEDDKSNGSGELYDKTFGKPLVTINIEPEPKVVQQDIIDMYMKSMQQFTESLAKMKLPGDFESATTSTEDSSSDQKTPGSKTPGSRVFYGSRAFF